MRAHPAHVHARFPRQPLREAPPAREAEGVLAASAKPPLVNLRRSQTRRGAAGGISSHRDSLDAR